MRRGSAKLLKYLPLVNFVDVDENPRKRNLQHKNSQNYQSRVSKDKTIISENVEASNAVPDYNFGGLQYGDVRPNFGSDKAQYSGKQPYYNHRPQDRSQKYGIKKTNNGRPKYGTEKPSYGGGRPNYNHENPH